MTTVPPLSEVVPVKVLVPESVIVPAPVLANPAVPLTNKFAEMIALPVVLLAA